MSISLMANPPQPLTIALQYQREGRFEDAEQVYRQVLEQQPDSIDGLNLLGALVYQQGRFQEAVSCFEQVLTLQPDNPDAYNSLGVALKGQGRAAEAVSYYRQALSLRSSHPEVYNNLGNALRELGQVEEAIVAYQQALKLKLNYPEAHNNLGALLKNQGKFEEAIVHYREAIALKPNYCEAYQNLGAALHRQGDLETAIQTYQQALQLKPNQPEVYNSLGNVLQQEGKFEAAIAQHQQAIVLKPHYPEAHHSWANALQQQGKLEAAVAQYQQALALRPDYPEACSNLGNALQEQGKPEEAIAQYQRALELRPDFAEALSNLGAILKDQRQFEQAIAHFERALALRPDYAEVHNNLGNVYQEQGKLEEAIACYRTALSIRPDFSEIHSNLGNMLQFIGEFEEAFDHFQQAIAAQPNNAGAYNNLGIALRNHGQIEASFAAYERAIELNPEFVEARWNKALTQLLSGDLHQGFTGYESRFQWSRFQRQTPGRSYPQPRWDGSPLNGKTIFLYAEQGMGDTIQFVRYATLLAQRGGTVIVESQPALVDLLQTVPGIRHVLPYGSSPPTFDVHAPLMSLPYILGTTVETIPAQIPYLGGKGTVEEIQGHGDAETRRPLKTQNSKLKTQNSSLYPSPLKVGIVWTGNPENPYNRARTCPLELLLGLASLPGICLYSLQKDLLPADLKQLQAHPEVQDLRGDLTDFVTTAKIIEELDLVISVDTAVAHLAGALGKAVWLLLPSTPDWRWLLEREDSPWYPTMCLFRQSSFGDWTGVIGRVREALREKAEGRKQKAEKVAGTWGRGDAETKDRDQGINSPRSSLLTPHSSLPQNSSPVSHPPLPIPEELKVAIRHHGAGRIREAEQVCWQILQQQEHPEVWHLLGLIAHQERKLEAAIAHYQKALVLNPDHYDTHNNLAVALHEHSQIDAAIVHYKRALVLKPDYADAHNNYANALRSKGRAEDAIAHYRQAIAHQPNYPDAHNNLGLALYAQGEFGQAAECYRQAIALRPSYAQAHNHLGNALKELGEFEQATKHYQQAIALKPDYAKAYNNWGNIFRDQGDLQTAIQHYDQATAIEPDFAEAHWNKALTLLIGGDLQQGFVEYEWRWHVKNLASFQPMRSFPAPPWDGSPLEGKTIFLHAEQGMGDIIQFVRYASLVSDRGGQIILECHAPLVDLFKSIPDIQQIVPYGSPPPPFDVHAPLMSLPYLLGTTLETVPAKVPYLRSQESGVRNQELRQGAEGTAAIQAAEPTAHSPQPLGKTQTLKLKAQNSKLKTQNSSFQPTPLKVGIVWSGNPENPYNRTRACPLELLLTLAALPNIQIYSLQKDPQPSDLKVLQLHSEVQDLRSQLTDFVQTAALIDQLDLVISVDTAVTHLAGALGKPVWLLLPFAPDWRWMLEREDSPWYPTMRLFRQSEYGDWQTVMKRVREALLEKAGGRSRHGDTGTRRHRDTNSNLKPQTSNLKPQTSNLKTPSPLPLESALQHYQTGNLIEAERICRSVLQRQPEQVEALNILGVILCRSGRADAAIAHLQKALTVKPEFLDAWCNLGSALQEQGNLREAIPYYQRAIALNPDYADAHYNLALVLQERDRLEEALAHCRRVVALRPNFADAHYSQGFVLRRLGQLPEAIASYQRAIQIEPDYPEAHKNLGHVLLLKGDFQAGFAEYEWRWRQKHWSPRPFAQPLWDGSPLQGKTILLHAEQGIGDTIQFIRYATLVKNRGGRVFVECPIPLLRLLKTVSGIDQLVAQNSPLPDFDTHAPLLSLPHILGTRLETMPAEVPYLKASGTGIQKTQSREQRADGEAEIQNTQYPALSTQPLVKTQNSKLKTLLHSPPPLKIGIVWAGNPEHKNNRLRSCGLAWFQTLLDVPGVCFFSLQKGTAATDLKEMSGLPIQNLSEQLNDFADTAAAIAQLDLIITVDTAVAHLAGALGKPVWTLLSFSPDWRWMLEREDSPWYPTMRLFRQHQQGDWQTVFEQVREALLQEIWTREASNKNNKH
jgi:tetratricopeptide (TPR) repeat protein